MKQGLDLGLRAQGSHRQMRSNSERSASVASGGLDIRASHAGN